MKQTLRSGFTLIELSIVLVIIGLIVGGILVGRDLIEAAMIRKQISQIDQVSAATNTSELKYNALPGDIGNGNAARFGLPLSPFFYNNHFDDGLINDWQAGAEGYTYSELMMFFVHLVGAGLIPATFVTGSDTSGNPCLDDAYAGISPFGYYSMAMDSRYGMIAASFKGANWLYLGVSGCASGQLGNGVDSVGVFSPAHAAMIDQKIDDGLPSTGNVFAKQRLYDYQVEYAPDPPGIGDNCVIVQSSTWIYNSSDALQNASNGCGLVVKLQ